MRRFIREEKSQESIIEVFSANEMKGIALGGRAQNSALNSQLNLLRELTNEANIGRSLNQEEEWLTQILFK